ncbi:MAG: Zinc uptake regulation protein [Alphaproteobacteria bacterium MarineAlpha5_Bin9]|nr:MAG: Zinc uptake regulation protein [Alphaproteobacteria bacterium MarineAlpha5_Bin9]|tara:strand:+ start:2075 stop:2479 length:405 start_codon:yes stop_codon:yes gene_type:complete
MPLLTEKLTSNQQTVLNLLEGTKGPLKAYAILFDIQKKGIKSPLQVYRALDKLIEIGKVHKIESKNSYIACSNNNCNSQTSTSFLICEMCDKVTELKKNNLSVYFSKESEKSNFKYTKHNLEIFGICQKCKKKI